MAEEWTRILDCGYPILDACFSAAKAEKDEVVANCDLKRGARKQALQTLVELSKMSPELRCPPNCRGLGPMRKRGKTHDGIRHGSRGC
jgi:hypothetical protein